MCKNSNYSLKKCANSFQKNKSIKFSLDAFVFIRGPQTEVLRLGRLENPKPKKVEAEQNCEEAKVECAEF